MSLLGLAGYLNERPAESEGPGSRAFRRSLADPARALGGEAWQDDLRDQLEAQAEILRTINAGVLEVLKRLG